ncbi:MAG TPA: phage holin family protein [Steroidobacteraceae bacterium]|jgi:uncharacterized membrane protein YqjE
MSEPAEPLIHRGKSLLEQLLRIAQTRLELLSAEVQQEKLALLHQWRLAVGALLCLCLAGVALIALLAIALPEDLRGKVLLGVFLALCGGALACWLALRRRARRAPLFSRVIQQVRLDRASLTNERSG